MAGEEEAGEERDRSGSEIDFQAAFVLGAALRTAGTKQSESDLKIDVLNFIADIDSAASAQAVEK